MADVTPSSTPKSYSSDSTLYLYTSLTAGSSHIITATSRLETILKANRIPFKALDIATDEKARMLWGRRSKGRKLPGLVRFGSIVGDLAEIEDWNEYGELKLQIGAVPAVSATPITSASNTPSKAAPKAFKASEPAQTTPAKGATESAPPQTIEPSQEDANAKPVSPSPAAESHMTLTMRQLGAEAAKKAGEKKVVKKETLSPKDTNEASTIEAETVNPEESAFAGIGEKDADKSRLASQERLANAISNLDVSASPASEVLTARKDQATKVPENAMSSTSSLQPDENEGTASSHRGSFVKTDVPKEVTEEAEKQLAIPETENTPGIGEKNRISLPNAAQVKGATLSGENLPGEVTDKYANLTTGQAKSAQVISSSEAEAPGAEGMRTQDQDPKSDNAATASVGD